MIILILIYLIGAIVTYGRLNAYAFNYSLKRYKNVLQDSQKDLIWLLIFTSWAGFIAQLLVELSDNRVKIEWKFNKFLRFKNFM